MLPIWRLPSWLLFPSYKFSSSISEKNSLDNIDNLDINIIKMNTRLKTKAIVPFWVRNGLESASYKLVTSYSPPAAPHVHQDCNMLGPFLSNLALLMRKAKKFFRRELDLSPTRFLLWNFRPWKYLFKKYCPILSD